jgi:rare lipoprotein A
MRAFSRSLLATVIGAALIAGCSTTQKPPSHATNAPPPQHGGGYYQDDGPAADTPANLDRVPDAVPRVEPYASGPNKPYSVFGHEYVPDTSDRPFSERGIGSWYGRKFNGQRTSSGEVYDMYSMTAAHPTLPIPSYARVTNLSNGRSVIVRVNDRGPFHSGRIIDLSFAAAYKLGYANQGSTTVEVEHLLPRDILAGRYAGAATLASATVANPHASSVAPPAAGTPAAISTPLPGTGAVAMAETLPDPAPPEAPSAARSPGAIDPDVPPDLVPTESPAAAAPMLLASPVAGHYLQLGAFRMRAGADDFLRHMARELDPTLAGRLRIVTGDSLYRVQIGPYSQRADAEGAARRLRDDMGYAVVVVSTQ